MNFYWFIFFLFMKVEKSTWLIIGFSSLFLGVASSFYYIFDCKRPTLEYKKTKKNEKILKSCEKLHEVYFPPFYLLNSHLHTILASGLFRTTNPNLKFDREILKDEEGGSISIDWVVSKNDFKKNSPVLIVYPGVTGTSQGNYVHQIATHFDKLHFRVVCANHRGLNSELTVNFVKIDNLIQNRDLKL